MRSWPLVTSRWCGISWPAEGRRSWRLRVCSGVPPVGLLHDATRSGPRCNQFRDTVLGAHCTWAPSPSRHPGRTLVGPARDAQRVWPTDRRRRPSFAAWAPAPVTSPARPGLEWGPGGERRAGRRPRSLAARVVGTVGGDGNGMAPRFAGRCPRTGGRNSGQVADLPRVTPPLGRPGARQRRRWAGKWAIHGGSAMQRGCWCGRNSGQVADLPRVTPPSGGLSSTEAARRSCAALAPAPVTSPAGQVPRGGPGRASRRAPATPTVRSTATFRMWQGGSAGQVPRGVTTCHRFRGLWLLSGKAGAWRAARPRAFRTSPRRASSVTGAEPNPTSNTSHHRNARALCPPSYLRRNLDGTPPARCALRVT